MTNVSGNKKFKGLSDLEPEFVSSVKLDRVDLKEGRLFWPVLYNFPELSLNMPINEFDEDVTFEELLYIISEGMTDYDPDGKFISNNVRIFFLDKDMKLFEFHINRTLKSVMSDKKLVISYSIAKLNFDDLFIRFLMLSGLQFLVEFSYLPFSLEAVILQKNIYVVLKRHVCWNEIKIFILSWGLHYYLNLLLFSLPYKF